MESLNMKTFTNILLAGGLLVAAGLAASSASAQCHDGFHHHHAVGPTRYLHFKVDGRPFVFDRVSSGIFCDGVKIGVREPSGKVTLFGNVPPVGGVATTPGGVIAGGPAVAGGPGAAGGVAVAGNPVGGVAPGAAGVAGPVGVAGGPVATPTAGGPVGTPGAGGPVAPGAAGARGGVAPAPAPTPAAAGGVPAAATPSAIPSLGSGNDPLAAAAQPVLPAIDISLLTGQWRAETKDIAGRVVVRELTFDEERNATLRVQAQGQEPLSIEGPFDMTGNQFVVTDGEDKRDLGQFTVVEKDRLVLQGEGETVNFSRVEEAPEEE
jgi:hypothetical protein